MKAAYFDEHGDASVLRVGDLPAPELVPGSVRIRVKACALNRLDIWVRIGGRAFDLPLPHVGGTDLAGIVAEVASDVEGVAVGDEVLVNPGLNFPAGDDGEQIPPSKPEIVGETRWGGLAEECVVPATNVLPKPANLSWEEAAALPLTGLTAMQMLRKARVGSGDRVLVLGAGGGVSVMAVQIAKALGAWVCATTSGAKMDAVAALGADLVVDYGDDGWSKQVFLATDKQGFDVVVDSVGEATWHHSLRALRPGGRLVTCGATTGPNGATDIRMLFWKQLTVLGSTMGTPADLERVLDLVRQGTLRPIVDSVHPLEDIKEAVARLEAGTQIGKVVLTP